MPTNWRRRPRSPPGRATRRHRAPPVPAGPPGGTRSAGPSGRSEVGSASPPYVDTSDGTPRSRAEASSAWSLPCVMRSASSPDLVLSLGRSGLDASGLDEFAILLVTDTSHALDDLRGVLTEERGAPRDPAGRARHLPRHARHRLATDQGVFHIDKEVTGTEMLVAEDVGDVQHRCRGDPGGHQRVGRLFRAHPSGPGLDRVRDLASSLPPGLDRLQGRQVLAPDEAAQRLPLPRATDRHRHPLIVAGGSEVAMREVARMVGPYRDRGLTSEALGDEPFASEREAGLPLRHVDAGVGPPVEITVQQPDEGGERG